MYRLDRETRISVATALVEGNSIRATCRMTGAAKGTVTRFLLDLGAACADYQDAALRDLPCRRIQADEIWTYVYAKAKNVPERLAGTPGLGDAWTWVAICQDCKIVPSWLVGLRDSPHAMAFMDDLASRLMNRVQLVTDGHRAYLDAVDMAFGEAVDYAMLIKEYAGEVSPRTTEARYSPSRVLSVEKQRVKGDPDLGAISTSNIERSNLTMRMSMRRFTRLTNGFSKKRTNLEAAVALHFMWYSFGRVHGSIGTTPAVKAGIAPYRWTMDEIVELLAHQEPASTRPARRAA